MLFLRLVGNYYEWRGLLLEAAKTADGDMIERSGRQS